MRHREIWLIVLICLAVALVACYGRALRGEQFAYRDSAHYYYPLHQRVQSEWNAGRWPLWEPEENSGMPLLGNPTAAVLYPGKIIFAIAPYPLASRLYIIGHTLLAFGALFTLLRGWGTSVAASGFAGAGVCVRGADPLSILQHHLSCGGGVGTAGPAPSTAGCVWDDDGRWWNSPSCSRWKSSAAIRKSRT